jgi:hypothetical protein
VTTHFWTWPIVSSHILLERQHLLKVRMLQSGISHTNFRGQTSAVLFKHNNRQAQCCSSITTDKHSVFKHDEQAQCCSSITTDKRSVFKHDEQAQCCSSITTDKRSVSKHDEVRVAHCTYFPSALKVLLHVVASGHCIVSVGTLLGTSAEKCGLW